MRKAVLFLTAALIGFAPVMAHAAESPAAPATKTEALTTAQREEIEALIKEYLTTKHPEVLAQGLQNLQKKEQASADALLKEQITSSKEKIYNDPQSPVGGNPKGDVTIVEFYDYQCGYCKMSNAAIEGILKSDKNVKFIYKEFPILGPVSTEAAKAALASVKQGKFQAFHSAMMNKKEHLTSDMIYEIAKDVGLNTDKLKKDMTDNSINEQLEATQKLGQNIGVRGTPMFLIGENVFPGAMQPDQLKQAVEDARKAAKK